jgi:hypothetical protein
MVGLVAVLGVVGRLVLFVFNDESLFAFKDESLFVFKDESFCSNVNVSSRFS